MKVPHAGQLYFPSFGGVGVGQRHQAFLQHVKEPCLSSHFTVVCVINKYSPSR